MASSFSKLYDAFISHRGPDVKETLAKQLYELLGDRGCRAFLDRLELEKGDSITHSIGSPICSSAVQIAIFSTGYADSSWCLDELVLMLEQRDHEKSLFIPVFYGVKPSDLRYIDKGAYCAAFSEYERKGRNLDKLDGWKKALQSALEVVGFELCTGEDNLCKEIVSCVEKEIERRIPLHVAPYPVGLGELVREFERRFEEPVKRRANVVGIFGFGGSGKTTMAKEIFNRKSSEYNASCFLYDVRESHAKGELHLLQRKLLKDLFSEEKEFRHIDEGTQLLMHNLTRAGSGKRFLIILDDIDRQDQLHTLLFQDLLSRGSLAIVTTRDKGVLISAEISNCYQMKTMDTGHAKELFLRHAFGVKKPTFPFEKLVERFVKFCGGLPLSLKVLGTHVRGRDEKYWELELEKVKDIQPNDVRQCLKISFDSLESEEKQIFMDIACFFIGREKDRAVDIWKATQWRTAEHAVQRLLDKCLVEVETKNDELIWYAGPTPVFRMHDHLRDFGRLMADKEVPRRLWRPEYLRSMRKRGFRSILAETNGRCYDKFEDSCLKFQIEYLIGNSNNYAGTSTALLWLGLVRMYKGNTIPSWFPVRQIRDLYASGIDELWSITPGRIDTQDSFQLRRLYLAVCLGLKNLPDLLKMLYHLEELSIYYSFQSGTEGAAFSKSLAKLSNLKTLHISGLPINGELVLSNSAGSNHFESSTNSCMSSLRKISFHLPFFSKLVISGDMCPGLQYLEIESTYKLTEVDLKLVKTLEVVSLHDCEDFKTISGLSGLVSLQELSILKCSKLKNVQGAQELEGLKTLAISLGAHASGLNFLSGLKRLPSDYIIIEGNAVHEAVARVNAKLFSDEIGDHAIAEIQNSRVYCHKLKEIRTSSTAIVLCVLHISAGLAYFLEDHTFSEVERIVAVVHTGQRDLQIRHGGAEILKGFMATANRGEEEWKALSVFKVIIDRLFLQRNT